MVTNQLLGGMIIQVVTYQQPLISEFTDALWHLLHGAVPIAGDFAPRLMGQDGNVKVGGMAWGHPGGFRLVTIRLQGDTPIVSDSLVNITWVNP